MRGCPFCGKPIRVGAMQCPYCREAVPHVQVASRVASGEGNAKIRRGLLYILLGGIVHYFAAGYSGFTLPVTVPPVVTTYGTPLVFAFGFGLLLHGLFLHLRS
jgi:hypothetical protein